MKEISFILPCYNAGKYLEECLSSMLSQSYPCHEFIAINDGSTDHTVEILKNHPEIKILNQTNQGVSAALNAGIDAATGTYLAFNDADDCWEPNKIALQVQALEQNPDWEAVFCRIQNFISPELNEIEKSKILCPPEPLIGLMKCCMLIKREAFEKYGKFNENYRTGDFVEWFSRAQDQGIRYGHIEPILVRRRLHVTNLSASPTLGKDFAKILKMRLDAKRNQGSI